MVSWRELSEGGALFVERRISEVEGMVKVESGSKQPRDVNWPNSTKVRRRSDDQRLQRYWQRPWG